MMQSVDFKQQIMFVVTTPFAVNAFLALHIARLSTQYRVVLCVNLLAYELDPNIEKLVDVVDIRFERGISPLSDVVSLARLVFAILKYRPKSIHSITPKAGLLAMAAGFIARVPHRWHTFTGQVWTTRRSAMRLLLRVLDRIVVLLSTQVFADSDSQCRFLEKEGLVRAGAVSVLGKGSICGVDVSRFCVDGHTRAVVRDELNCHFDGFVFLYVGRLARDKGIADLVEAFGNLHERYPRAMLWVVGPDEAGLLQVLQRLSVRFQDALRWIGATTSPERFMAASDCLVLPSYREGFGSVLIEAGACGVPAVAYRIDGVVDAVEDQQTGLLVECGNKSLLQDAMVHMLESPAERSRMGLNAYSRVRREFNCNAITSAWEAHYRKFV